VTITRTQAILFGAAGIIVAVVFFLAGSQCSTPITEVVVQDRGIDAGPGESEIGGRLDASLHAGAVQIEQIEDKFEDDMAAFDAEQQAEYDRLRGGSDLDATARYLSEWSRRRRRDGGR